MDSLSTLVGALAAALLLTPSGPTAVLAMTAALALGSAAFCSGCCMKRRPARTRCHCGGWCPRRSVRQGDHGDRLYVTAGGEADVTTDGRFADAGEGFGEIALLRDTPRTATVAARTPLRVFTLDRRHFLAAVSGYRSSMVEADQRARAPRHVRSGEGADPSIAASAPPTAGTPACVALPELPRCDG